MPCASKTLYHDGYRTMVIGLLGRVQIIIILLCIVPRCKYSPTRGIIWMHVTCNFITYVTYSCVVYIGEERSDGIFYLPTTLCPRYHIWSLTLHVTRRAVYVEMEINYKNNKKCFTFYGRREIITRVILYRHYNGN